MLQGIDLNSIRQYNTTLKSYKEKAANLNAQIEYANNELVSLCNELSAELGKEVNVTNVEQIYREQVEKINSTLQSGNTVLAKIASEESALQAGATATAATAGAAATAMTTGAPSAPVMTGESPTPPQQAPTFAQIGNASPVTTLPPLPDNMPSIEQPLFKLG